MDGTRPSAALSAAMSLSSDSARARSQKQQKEASRRAARIAAPDARLGPTRRPGSVLPGLGDFPISRIAELTPAARATRN